jgi:hypothetical protein
VEIGAMVEISPARQGDTLERRVAMHYTALRFHVTRNVNLLNHQIDLLVTKYVPGIGMTNTMVEIKHRGSKQIGINEVTPFLNTTFNK